MAVKLQFSNKSLLVRFLRNPWGRAFAVSFTVSVTLGLGLFTYFYVKYSRFIEETLRTGPFANTSTLYAAPRPVMVGAEANAEEMAAYLRRAGYSESNSSRMGWYKVRPDAIEVNPGPAAFDSEGATIKISGRRVTEIISLRDHTQRSRYYLEPEMITNLFDSKREKRRVLHFDDIPKIMVNAVLAAEDKHFFTHAGFDPFGILRAVWKDLRGERLEGASTLTQQLARELWLAGNQRGWRRKIPETLITLHLEQKLTKQQIFEDYATAIYIGNQGSFSIHGFGQGAQVYFGKDLSDITLPEAALLAGLPQGPQLYDPFRHPDRAVARRNVVLRAMHENGLITTKQLTAALETPLHVTREAVESSDAPYFVDLVSDTLQGQFQNRDFQSGSYRVYTTLDMNLQHDAVAAIRKGILETDQQWKRRDKKYGTDEFPLAQVALIALDAETGEVKALVGGRSYGVSQLDHAVAKRQPGSSFKPFVYLTGMLSALDPEARNVLTPASTVMDEPTTFWFDEKPYEPANFKDEYVGPITLREALAHSKNIPAVKVAEAVGYNKVAQVAHSVGLNVDIKPTPAIALGSYDVTPLEIAGAYTVFPNGGDLLKPTFLKSIRARNGESIYDGILERKKAVDPRAAYLVENMMEEVLVSGTGAGVHSYGFNLPSAGKTGTSRDGWFAGFTSKLICVVWVGFDDNRDFKLEGARSALPIWAEFMRTAHQHREYRGVHPFSAPEGVITVDIDAETGELASPSCPRVRSEVFIAGTQPLVMCRRHGNGRTQVASWEPVQQQTPEPTADPQSDQPAGSRPRSIAISPAPSKDQPAREPGKGFLGRLKDLFK